MRPPRVDPLAARNLLFPIGVATAQKVSRSGAR